jgi:hypothetical protein
VLQLKENNQEIAHHTTLILMIYVTLNSDIDTMISSTDLTEKCPNVSYEAMEIAYNAGQVSEIIAFHKSNMKLNATDVNGNPIDWDALDKHKFNMLFSEDLY